MNNDKIKEVLERIKSAKEFADDYSAYVQCLNIVNCFERGKAVALLQDLTKRYQSQINQFGFLVDGVRVIHGVNYDNVSDLQIKEQLEYIARYIPVYALIREGESKIVNNLLNIT